MQHAARCTRSWRGQAPGKTCTAFQAPLSHTLRSCFGRVFAIQTVKRSACACLVNPLRVTKGQLVNLLAVTKGRDTRHVHTPAAAAGLFCSESERDSGRNKAGLMLCTLQTHIKGLPEKASFGLCRYWQSIFRRAAPLRTLYVREWLINNRWKGSSTDGCVGEWGVSRSEEV